ncbi:zinc-dependent alcohol dehydrogenase family protein [Botrimarina mediterranea]|uniref:Alcohol dehydrogenase n=1 Tax=Botrimarina mediterranea TaxID=2528022 RepID=A0A518K494_9BACT|nr:zinc-dependent alcohol dehydrogenase family protein [Botrimarina mediterranea]QDV72611.1 Alcohol dehydrogenase [Botrimarina mediterranea]
MQAVLYHAFGAMPELATVADPAPADDGVVIRVEATGLCRSDWHGWRGHDPDIRTLPHVPGHELAGVVVEVGKDVRKWRGGERVTVPFVGGCGKCDTCARGDQHVCPQQFQPGFSGWGSYAELVMVRYADENLLALPEGMTSIVAASLGCRLATAYRAVAIQAAPKPGDWVAVHGCGGVGLSAVMTAAALGARPIAVDIRPEPLELAKEFGAVATIDASRTPDVAAAIVDLTHGGADSSLDALGSRATFANSLACLRRRGRHVQVGLLVGDDADPRVAMGRVLGWELEIVGSHGLQAHLYAPLFDLVSKGKIDPLRLVDRTIPLAEAPAALAALGDYRGAGMTIVDLEATPPLTDSFDTLLLPN